MDKKPKYFQLEPTAFLSDIDFQMMTAQERGVYFTVILYLYANGGAIGSGIDTLQTLCNYGHDMLGWQQMWDNIKHKFQVNNNGLVTHKRVTKEIAESEQRMQVAKESGLKGAQKRWGVYSDPIAGKNRVPIAKISKGKVSKGKKNNNPERAIPDNLLDPKFLKAWYDWQGHRTEIKHKLTPTTIERQLKMLAGYSVPEAVAIIEKSIQNGWQGLFPDRLEAPAAKKTKLFPISGKTCSKRDCGLPAVYKDSSGAYDSFSCTEHLPAKVKERFE